MQYNRILVLGCSGSGKSTFARRLGEITDLPVVHLDRLYLKPGWAMPPKEEFQNLLQDALSKKAWIMDGNYGRTLPLRLQYCDQVIYFHLPRVVCMWGIISRMLKNYGRNRPDVGEGCRDTFRWDFITYTWKFEKTHADNRRLLYASEKPVVTFRSRREARRYLEGAVHDNT